MNERRELILKIIINEHVITGSPVGSSVLVDKYKLNMSSATVRNEMAELEEDGYITQPHTSAGRIPTEKAYSFYILSSSFKPKLKEKNIKILENAFKKDKAEKEGFKNTAKALAEVSGLAVFWAFHKRNLYYTGISNLFQQPEFRQSDLIYNISTVIDSLDDIIYDIFDRTSNGAQIIIGSKNPFGEFCGTILAKYKEKNNVGMFGIIGPIRMDYENNLGLAEFINKMIIR